MENKATLSYSFSQSGDENLFLTLSTKLVDTLSNHTVEWRHTYGRLSHQLRLNVKILPLLPALLERKDLVTRPYCHIFWTDCSDADLYRSSLKGEISEWLNLLTSHEITDWIIVVITGDVLSRITKAKLQLPRMSITDKVKADFCSKNPERLHVLFEPNRESTKSLESWTALGGKVANMTVRCMETVVAKYEDHVRSERERRNEKSWDFCSYFLLQEELAFMYEMLEMYGSALVQYDELDAMFTQYVLNANAGDIAHWLTQFSRPITRWHSLLLWKRVDSEARQMISSDKASLIDIRNYLFNRLCHLLFQMGKVTELTQRMHYFLHSIATEIDILEIEIPSGAVECWVFMCCLELVDSLKRKSDVQSKDGKSTHALPPDMNKEKLLLQNASLWNLARLKLFHLGKLCGLMPGDKTTSSHLQMVVDLLAGMGEGEERGDITVPPSLVLREAISSKNNFQKQYFELSELAMGTFKHMGHYRAARSIGSDLAEFYLMLGEPAHAEGYLVDTVRMFANDGWRVLYTKANQTLAKCYKQMLNIRKYLRLCYALMCDEVLSLKERSFYCDEYRSMSTDLGDRTLAINVWPLASVTSIRFLPVRSNFRIKSKQYVEVFITSYAPKPMTFQQLNINLEKSSFDKRLMTSNNSETSSPNPPSTKRRHPSLHSRGSSGSRGRHRHQSSTSSKDVMIEEFATLDPEGRVNLLSLNYNEGLIGSRPSIVPPSLNLHDQRDVSKDGTLSWAGLTCRHAHEILRRQDSNPSLRSKHSVVTSVAMETYTNYLTVRNVILRPGANVVKVEINTEEEGFYQMQQLRLSFHKTFFVLPRVYPIVNYAVTKEKPNILIKHDKGLICGKVEIISLTVSLGDEEISHDQSQKNLVFDLSQNLRLLKVVKCKVTSSNDVDELVESDGECVLSAHGDKANVQLPSCPVQSVIHIQLACVCLVEHVTHQLEFQKRHRRTHSAPPATFSRSPKSTPRHRPIVEANAPVDDSLKAEIPAVNGKQEDVVDGLRKSASVTFDKKTKSDKLDDFKNTLKDSLKFDVSPFKLFRSKSNVEPMEDQMKLDLQKTWSECGHIESSCSQNEDDEPVIRINGDLIEVTLDDDVSDDVTSVSSSTTKEKNSEITTDDRSSTAGFGILQYTEEDVRPVRNQLFKNVRHSPSKSDIGLRGFSIKPKMSVQPILNSSHCEIAISSPWDDVDEVTSSLSFAHPLEFTHAWSYSGHKHRYLTVTVSNVTSDALLLHHPKAHFSNVNALELTYMGRQSDILLKAKGSCALVWKADIPENSANHLSVQCDVCIATPPYDDVIDDALSTATYKFQIENVLPIYKVRWWPSSSEHSLRCGVMTGLHIEVEKMRNDTGHENSSGGNQLLMYQVVDNRGRWAVCGKSSGVLSFKCNAISSPDVSDDVRNVASATLEIMPLAYGRLHLPYVLINRYLKRRSSEFDERFSSMDSPVLKPPQLKPFVPGEVFYQEQGKQVNVLSSDDVDNGRAVTKL